MTTPLEVLARGRGSDGAPTRLPGVVIAGATAIVSGISVFVNSYGVHAVRSPTVYTTAKNLVAAVFLGVMAAAMGIFARHRETSGGDGSSSGPQGTARPRWLELSLWRGWPGFASACAFAYVGVVGGGIAFVMFFNGLARTTAEPASFLHDTMIIWVAVIALPVLRERLSAWNIAAIGLLLAGQIIISGGIGHLVGGEGEMLVLGATVLWALETVVAKRLLRATPPAVLGTVRMGVGAVVLLSYTAVTGKLGQLFGLDLHQATWIFATGSLLALYVGTWMVALSRARAVDVTSVLVGSVVITYLLQYATGHGIQARPLVGLALVAIGCIAVIPAWRRPRVREPRVGLAP